MNARHVRNLSLLVLVLAACGGSPPPVHDTHVLPPPPPPPVDAGPPPEVTSFTGATAEQLAQLVDTHARARIAEVQPDFDVAQLDAYRASPDGAPAISGRTVERLMDLAVVALVRGELDAAEKTIRLVRTKAKNRNSAWAATTLLSEIARRRAGADAPAQEAAIAGVLRELPKNRFGAATVVFQIVQTEAQVNAEVAETKAQLLSLETASSVLFADQILRGIVQNRDRFLAAIATVRAENDQRPDPPLHDFALLDMAHEPHVQPVVVAVWDTGVDLGQFHHQEYTVANEVADGRDENHDGLVDDVHGIVADGLEPNTALLYEPDEDTITHYAGFLRGIMDLRAGMASTPDAQHVLELERGVTDVDQLKALDRNLDAIGEWAHGTHVAGILTNGITRAKLAVFRSAWAGETRVYYERGPTDAELHAEQANMAQISAFIRANHVRVVNASLGFSVDYLEDQLRHETGTYTTDDAVRARARQIQELRKQLWAGVIQQCPDTLFVVAAGNSNRDVIEYDDIPASIDAPNLLVVGAVNKWGEWATFTNSSPERVHVFGLGVEVDSVIPNGTHVPLSGTSMASPFVANTATKMIAVNGALTPAQVIRIITSTGDAIAAPFNGVIANQHAAIEAARHEPRIAPAVPTPPPAHAAAHAPPPPPTEAPAAPVDADSPRD